MIRSFIAVVVSRVVLAFVSAGVLADPGVVNARSLEPALFEFPAQDAATTVIAPVRPGLGALTFPQLDELEPAVAEQFREARQLFERTAAEAPSAGTALAEAYGSLGRLFHAYEFFEAAEASYINAARLAPDEVRWPHLLGYVYQQTGRLEESAEKFIAARRVQPDDHAATMRLGEVYLGLNRLREARDEFRSVVAIFPAGAHSGLGELALRERRFAEAIEHFNATLERVPQATSLHYSLAMAYRGLGRLDDARSHLQLRGAGGIRVGDPIVDALQTLIRGERGLVLQGRRAYDAGQFQDAADTFKRAIDAAPASAIARANLGLALLELDDEAGAAEQFEAALRLDGGNVSARASLGFLLVRQGRDADAAAHLRAAFELAPEDANVSREFLYVLLRLGRKDDAITVLTRARSFHPDDEEALVSLSILLADRERYREAIALLEDAHRRFSGRVATATTLARLLASSPDSSLRDGRRALELAVAVHASEPVPAHTETVAIALAELGRCGEAAEWMRRAVTEAEGAKNATEAARLRGETAKYETASCRPPGQ